MASLNDIIPGGFSSKDVAPSTGFGEPLPAGLYDVEITGAEVKETAKRNGTGLKIEYTVISPADFENRKIFGFLNLKHENSQAEQIGQSQLSALCRAVGVEHLNDSDQLFGKVLRVRVKVRPAQGTYEASNEVTSWEQAGAGPAPGAVAAAPTPAPGKPAAKPWERKAA